MANYGSDIDRMNELVHLIKGHNVKYYSEEGPEILDVDYDALFKELVELEKQFPEFVRPDSPTQTVGSRTVRGMSTLRHHRLMLSLDNIFNESELRSWLHVRKPPYTVEWKYDGMAINLTYSGGSLRTAATRGDGIDGVNITEAVAHIPGIQKQIPVLGTVEIRGEVILDFKAFAEINADRTKDFYKAAFVNTRNAVAGLLTTKTINPNHLSKLSFKGYAYLDGVIASQQEALKTLEAYGFITQPDSVTFHNEEDVCQYVNSASELRGELPFAVDGIVIKVDDLVYGESLGYSARYPHSAIAYKFQSEEGVSRLRDVHWEAGRTGVLTPVAIIDQVTISGVKITSVNLHNLSEMNRLGLTRDCEIIVTRAGEVIPKIVKVTKEGIPGSHFEAPLHCPCCRSPVVQNGSSHFCEGGMECSIQVLGRLEHFVSREAVDIQGISTSTIADLLFTSVSTPDDFYKLTVDDFENMLGYGQKRVANILEAINKRRQIPLARFITGLGILGVGETTAKELARVYTSFEAFRKASIKELLAIDGIGDFTANSIVRWLATDTNKTMIDNFYRNGVVIVDDITTTGPLTGKTICVTGTIEGYDRHTIKSHLIALGATVHNSVKHDTMILLVGTNPGKTKVVEAEHLDIPMLTLDDILKQ